MVRVLRWFHVNNYIRRVHIDSQIDIATKGTAPTRACGTSSPTNITDRCLSVRHALMQVSRRC